MEKRYVLIALVALLAAGCVGDNENTTTTLLELRAAEGDTVYVNYIGRLMDGSVFDTSYEETAKDAGIYDILRDYSPLEFEIGSGSVISGFEEAVVGMAVGEEKTVRLTPSKAYGNWDPELVFAANRTQIFPRFMDMSLDEFESDSGMKASVNLTYDVGDGWIKKVVGLSDEKVTVRIDPLPNATASTNFGPAQASWDNESIYLTVNPENNTWIMTDAGPARIVDLTEEYVNIDLNHRLAGKTLIFDIRVEDIRR